jgi:hypothetical protein
MPLRHACFISYRHGQHSLMKRFVDDFCEALASELEALVEMRIYRDQLRLEGGDFYTQALATGLCESVCLIMIFTPTYFSSEHSYCAREYAAMKLLEKERLPIGQQHGLIIPVVLRGFDQLPEEIRSRRQAYNFDHFSLSDQRLVKNKNFKVEIRKMADYIAARCLELQDISRECGDFEMPAESEVQNLLSRFRRRESPFPGRGTASA